MRLKTKIRIWYHKLPGKALGEFRMLPLFFVMGAALEFTMIHWHVGEVNFYKTYKKNRINEEVERRLSQMQAQSV